MKTTKKLPNATITVEEYKTLDEMIAGVLRDLRPGEVVTVHTDGCEGEPCTCKPTVIGSGGNA